MLVIHAGFVRGSLWLWGETPQEPAGRDEIARALAAAGEKPSATYAELTAWLPAAPSSPLIGMGTPGPLAPRSIGALALEAKAAVDFLAACVGKHVLEPGVVIGDDITWWAAAMRFAGVLVAHERFLPSLGADGRACWKPVILGPDLQRMHKLAASMPGVARALACGDTAPTIPAAAVLNDFVAAAVDEMVRSAGGPAGGTETVHDAWIRALTTREPEVRFDRAEVSRLAGAIREWQRPVWTAIEAPFRLCFRLEEPETDNGAWHVRYLLQANDDPSLLVAAEKVWHARRNRALDRPGFQAREHLLFSLGQASAMCPRIDASLRSPAPAGYETDAHGANEFLSLKSAELEQAGFGVLLPAWWTRRGTKTRLTARAHVKAGFDGGGGLTLNDVMQFEWQVALGGEPLTLAELRALADLKSPLVKVRGQWVQVSAEEIRAALDFWQKKTSSATMRDVIRMALGAVEQAGAIQFEGVTAEGWMAEMLAQLEGRAAFEELPPPEGLHVSLRPYQVRGYSWLAFLRRWGLGACLADDMGLGKTIQALSLIERDRRVDGQRPVLLVCPTSVIGNWQREAERFTPGLSVLVHHGGGRAKGDAFRERALQNAVVISSYALLARDAELLRQVPWSGVVLDEAQNIKNPETRQAGAARSIPADYRIALTGTPVENNVGDLWSIMEFLNPGFLGARSDFKRKFFLPIQSNRDPGAAARLKSITGPFILRRLKTDRAIIRDLPEKMEMKVFCNLTKEQASLYAAVVKDAESALKEAEGIQRKGLVLATLSKLKQVCNHPAQFLGDNSPIPGRSGKLARLTEMLEEMLESDDRALVFTQFAEMGGIVQRHIQETFGREALFLHGAVSKKQRDTMVMRFQEEPDGPRVFVLSLKAGGTGLNLTRANHVFHFDRWWNPAVENQATDRAFRIGQTRNVQVHKFLCIGTLEERIDEMIERKKEIAANVVGTGEAWLTELSNAQLKDLFALRKEAVGE